jgi:hypothetical protein
MAQVRFGFFLPYVHELDETKFTMRVHWNLTKIGFAEKGARVALSLGRSGSNSERASSISRYSGKNQPQL